MEAPAGMTKSKLTLDCLQIGNSEIITKGDIGTNHRMVRAGVKINKMLMRRKKIQKQKPLNLDLRVLKISNSLQNRTENRFETLKDDEPSIEKLNQILRESVDTIRNKIQKSTIKKSTEDTEIESLEMKRKELKDKVEYAELNKLAKKKRRTRAPRERKELIQETLQARKGPRQINRQRNKQMIMSLGKKIWRNHIRQRRNSKNTHRFLQVTLYPNSAHTGKYNEIKSRHRRNNRVYRRSRKDHKKDEKTQSQWNGWNYN